MIRSLHSWLTLVLKSHECQGGVKVSDVHFFNNPAIYYFARMDFFGGVLPHYVIKSLHTYLISVPNLEYCNKIFCACVTKNCELQSQNWLCIFWNFGNVDVKVTFCEISFASKF